MEGLRRTVVGMRQPGRKSLVRIDNGVPDRPRLATPQARA
nr:hypothetical protein [Kibdelosporangium sp. MJ126-NF4]